jgi:hypothetical protein
MPVGVHAWRVGASLFEPFRPGTKRELQRLAPLLLGELLFQRHYEVLQLRFRTVSQIEVRAVLGPAAQDCALGTLHVRPEFQGIKPQFGMIRFLAVFGHKDGRGEIHFSGGSRGWKLDDQSWKVSHSQRMDLQILGGEVRLLSSDLLLN